MMGFLRGAVLIAGISCLALIAHEALHWLCAWFLRLNPRLRMSRWFVVSVQYDNAGSDWKHLVTSACGPVVLVLIGLSLPHGDTVVCIAKTVLLLNLCNLLPITNDGEVIAMSVTNILVRQVRVPSPESAAALRDRCTSGAADSGGEVRQKAGLHGPEAVERIGEFA